MGNELCSKHIFIFPFKIETLINEKGDAINQFTKKTNLSKINKIIKKNRNLHLEEFKDLFKESDSKKRNLNYNTELYFYDNIRNTVFTGYSSGKNKKRDLTEEIVLNYNYKIAENSKYIIKDYKAKEYILDLKKIKLKIFETGVGSLSFFVDNYNKEYDKEDILKINSLGRRIYIPFKNGENNEEILAKEKHEIPDFIEITGVNSTVIREDFRNNDNNKYKNIRLSSIITETLGFVNINAGKDKIEISPIIDSRMYTIMINNQENYFNKYLPENRKCIKSYKKDEYWYKNIFVDNNNCMCQDDEMLERLIVSSTYSRFLKWKSLYGISRYSFVLLKENNNEAFLNDTMENIYYEMIILVLAQRASVLNFSDEISRISRLESENVEKINELYKNYLQFVNRLFIVQPTAQEQGIELYNLLIEKSDVILLIDNLNNEMESLHEYARLLGATESKKSLEVIESLNKWLLIPTFIVGLLGINIFQDKFRSIESVNPFKKENFFNGDFFIELVCILIFSFGISFLRFELVKIKKWMKKDE